MSLDKSRIPKLSDSSRKFLSKKERKSMNDPIVERIERTRTSKGEKFQPELLKLGVKIIRRTKGNARRLKEAEQRETRLIDDMEKLRIQQEQILDTRIGAMMERRTQPIMDRLYGLIGNRS